MVLQLPDSSLFGPIICVFYPDYSQVLSIELLRNSLFCAKIYAGPKVARFVTIFSTPIRL
jgi:hypothetical protein